MEELNFVVKLTNVFNLLKNPLVWLSLLLLLGVTAIFIININNEDIKFKKLNYLVYSLTLLIIFIIFSNQIFKLFDNFLENIIKGIYFPSMVIYISIIIIANFILFTQLNKRKINYKVIINIIFYIITMILFIMFLNETKGITLNDSLDIYLNVNTKSLLELTTFITVIWYLIILINYIVNKLSNKKIVENKPIERVKPIRYKEPFSKEEYLLILKLLKKHYEDELKK